MTARINARLKKLEKKHREDNPEYKIYTAEELIERDIAQCVIRYGFSEEETRKRMQRNIEAYREMYKKEPDMLKFEITSDDEIDAMPEEELDLRIGELMDKEYLELFPDTKNPDISEARIRKYSFYPDRTQKKPPPVINLKPEEHKTVAPDKELEAYRKNLGEKRKEEAEAVPLKRKTGKKGRARNTDFLEELSNW